MGEGLWKWRMQEYKVFSDHSITNELIIKTVQYLALKNKNEVRKDINNKISYYNYENIEPSFFEKYDSFNYRIIGYDQLAIDFLGDDNSNETFHDLIKI